MSVLGIQIQIQPQHRKKQQQILKPAQLGMTVDGHLVRLSKQIKSIDWRAMLGKNQIRLTWRATPISTRPHSFWAFSLFFPSSRGSPGRLQVAGNSLWGYIPPMIEFPRPKKNKPTRANPPGEIQHDCRQDCPALPGIIRIAGFSRDHWLPDWCCGFSTTIPVTAPKRHTSPPRGDASSRLITTNVKTTAQKMVCCIGREHVCG